VFDLFKIAYKFSAAESAPSAALRCKGTVRSSELRSISPSFSSRYTLYGDWKYHGVLLFLVRRRWASNSVFFPCCSCKWTIYRCSWWYEKKYLL